MHYANAPIVEAVIDIQVRYRDSLTIEQIQSFASLLKATFPNQSPLNFFSLEVKAKAKLQETSDAGTVRAQNRQVGLRLDSEKKDRVLQVRDKAFSYSHLRPYTEWSTFKLEAERLWVEYLRICQPLEVKRIAVRYINRIVIPGSEVDFPDYFKVYPNVPDEYKFPSSGFFMQVQLPQPDLPDSTHAVLHMAPAEGAGPNEVAVVLDFDVFRTCSIEPNSEEVWKTLDQLRDRKNHLFEMAITDRIREIIR